MCNIFVKNFTKQIDNYRWRDILALTNPVFTAQELFNAASAAGKARSS